MQLDHQIGAKNRKFLLFIDQWAAYPRDTTALKNIKVIFSPQIAQAICNLWIGESSMVSKCWYRKQLIWQAVAMIDTELLGDAGSPDL